MNVCLVARWPIGGIKTYINYIFRSRCFKNNSYELVTPALGLESYFNDVFSESDFSYQQGEESGKGLHNLVLKQLLGGKVGIVHSHGLTTGLMLAPLVWLFRTPHVVTLHDVFLPSHFVGFKGKLKYQLIKQLLKFPTVLNPCGYDAAENLQLTFPTINKAKIKPVRNGIDISKFSVESVRDLRGELNLSENTLLLGFFGRFMRQKGFDLLVDAIRNWSDSYPDKPLHIACFGWGAYIREEQDNIKKLGLETYFTFMPNTDDMPAALRGVDAAVMPSRWEACPLLPMEAMISGAVVLASDCIGMSEVCKNSPALVHKNSDVDDLVRKISTIADDSKKLKASADAFKNEARKKFDVENTALQLADIYKSVMP